jgi:HEAT repeat protein
MDEEQTGINEEELDLVRDILKTLTKTIRTFNVYPKGNPIYQKFVSDLFAKFNLFFESAEELTIGVQQYSLLYKENEVFRSEEKTENIALLLFADGLRQLNFQKGITYEEVTDFIEILRAALKSKTTDDDDIVTLLWEKNIRNMGYIAVEDTVDDDLAVEETLLQADHEPAGEEMDSTISSASFDWRPESVSPVAELQPLSEEEITAMKGELSVVEDNFLPSAAGLFLEVLAHEPDTEAFPAIATSIGKILDMALNQKNIAAAIEVLRGLKEVSALYREPSHLAILNGVMSTAASAENLKIVFESSGAEDIKKYLHFLDRNSLPDLIQLLGDLQDRRQRRLLCDVLAEKGREDIEVLADALKDERWYLVRNLVLILGMTREPSAVKHLAKTLRHRDVRVRREVVRALESIRTDDAKRLFVSVLNDSDLTVRLASLKALRRFQDPDLFETLKQNASRDELKKKSFTEKKELLETLALLGGDNAFPVLTDLFKKGWLIEKDDVTEMRAAAAYGLGLIGSKEALTLLQKEAGSRKNLLREACTKALKESRQSGNVRN